MPENIIVSSEGDMITISCRRGLWSVSANESELSRLAVEAACYYTQYEADGEYDEG